MIEASEASGFLACLLLFSLAVLMASSGASTEIESGYIQASSTGTISEDLGFRPDYIEFITAQQIESTSFRDNDPTNNDCPDNVNGWSEGSVIFDSSGVEKQFSLGMFRNSDSTNAHITASSNSHVIRNVYSEQGQSSGSDYECGRLEVSVTGVGPTGFEVEVEEKYDYDEIIRYKAYQFPDNMDFDAGMVKVTSTGPIDVTGLGFQPANLHIRAGQQITSDDSVNHYWRAPAGRSKGYATLDDSGNVIDQQSIGTASSSDSTNAHRSLASDQYVLNTVYVDQNANVLGRLNGSIAGADGDGFTMNIEEKSYGSDEMFLYRAWGQSYYNFTIGHRVIDNSGSQSFDIGFEPDAIDIYAEQQISSINNEVVTPGNSGCDNAGGWSNGFYETDDDRQWSLFTGRTSDSQNSHRYGASNSEGLRNVYSGQDGDDCGDFWGEVTGVSGSGFTMDFSHDSEFDSNYDEEMVYYRAFRFPLFSPTVTDFEFYNSSNGHAFGLRANVSEGANDISSCEIEATGPSGNSRTYPGTAVTLTDAKSQCRYQWINVTDNTTWENRHDNNGDLVELDVAVTASDVDGLSDQKTVPHRFPNNRPYVKNFTFYNRTSFHGFDVRTVLQDLDSENSDELESCSMNFSDDDGNQVLRDPSIDYGYGNSDQASCYFDNVNASMPYPSSLSDGFQVLEDIDVEVNVTDVHSNHTINTSSHPIPNNLPFAEDPNPSNGNAVISFPVELKAEVEDTEGDGPLNATLYNVSGHRVEYEEDIPLGDVIDATQEDTGDPGDTFEWNVEVEDPWGKRNTTFSFVKQIGAAYRTGLGLELNYSSIILNAGGEEYTELTVSNDVDNTKDITVNLTGVEAEFLDGDEAKTFPDFEAESRRTFTIRIDPDEPTDEDLTVVVENNDIGITTEKTLPVTVLENSQTANEVPGITLIQFLAIFAGATVLYSVRL